MMTKVLYQSHTPGRAARVGEGTWHKRPDFIYYTLWTRGSGRRRWLAGGGGFVMLLTLALASSPASAQGDHGFRFVRIQFEDGQSSGWRRGGAAWSHDHPTGELNLYEALKRTTNIHVEGPPLVLTLKDERIFEYPVLYLCEPGFWTVGDEEAQNLSEYLRRGGFILFDDFRGDREWAQFYEQMKRVLPDTEPVPLPPEHPVWSIYYDVDPVAAPSNVSGGWFTHEDDQYLAYFGEDGRMVALACYNQDIGDGWEWPERNLAGASTISFQMGVNFLIYAFTH